MLEIQGRRVKSREVEFAEESRVCRGRRRAAAWGRRYRFVEQRFCGVGLLQSGHGGSRAVEGPNREDDRTEPGTRYPPNIEIDAIYPPPTLLLRSREIQIQSSHSQYD